MPGFDLRMAVLHVDRTTDLPLEYTYETEENVFRTVGFVRLGGHMVAFVEHAGRDTPDERDRFLLKVLRSVLIPADAARRIVLDADHLPDTGPATAASRRRHEERDGTHLAPWGLLAGLVVGLAVGGLLAGWNGAVIGAFVGASTFPDLLVAAWQVAHRNSTGYVEVHDSWAIVMVAAGSVVGGVVGYLLGPPGFGQACGVFLGMTAAAFVLGLIATTFSMAPFRLRSMMWLGPLIVGAAVWLAALVWSHPVSLVLGVVVGSLVARIPARRIAESVP
ncbi:hypothetical protein [Pseudonocardia endophytica]|uniref:Uncharacterized protein n=1 Tax=Pseudonocardia endophytica TaxID=401976 RepID=A0A4R1HNS5_PSEEN|nr:hypothetical protein [Pseudonocardia endophytica]TCK22265.1 hypothetical protein EV378_6266 [Pseudonocardia endophytica]